MYFYSWYDYGCTEVSGWSLVIAECSADKSKNKTRLKEAKKRMNAHVNSSSRSDSDDQTTDREWRLNVKIRSLRLPIRRQSMRGVND